MEQTRLTRRSMLGSLMALGVAGGEALWGLGARPAPGQFRGGQAAEGVEPVLLNSNENPFPPPERVLQAMARGALLGHRYPDDAEADFSEYLAGRHAVKGEQLLPGCGSSELLKTAAAAFTGPHQGLVVADPTFEILGRFSEARGARVIRVPLSADRRHDLETMSARCRRGVGLIYVCNPNNPTGTVMTRAEIEGLLTRLPRNITVLVDEAYHHFVKDPAYASCEELIARDSRVVVLRTFSKLYGLAGMRLGYALGSSDRITAMRRHRLPNSPNVAALYAGRACLEQQAHFERCLEDLLQTRQRLSRGMAALGWAVIPSQANFVMADTGRDVIPLIQALAEEHIYVGRKFPALGTHLRVSLGTNREIERFLSAAQRLLEKTAVSSAVQ